MAISYPNGAVTLDGWSVGRTTGDGMPKGGRLSVFKGWHGHDKNGFPKFRPGDWEGKEFADDSEYESFVRSHGYVQPYFRSVATFKAMNRDYIRISTQVMRDAVLRAESHKEIVALADWFKRCMAHRGCDILDSIAFSNGVYAAARRLRPDLYKPQAPAPMTDDESAYVAELFDETDSDHIPAVLSATAGV